MQEGLYFSAVLRAFWHPLEEVAGEREAFETAAPKTQNRISGRKWMDGEHFFRLAIWTARQVEYEMEQCICQGYLVNVYIHACSNCCGCGLRGCSFFCCCCLGGGLGKAY